MKIESHLNAVVCGAIDNIHSIVNHVVDATLAETAQERDMLRAERNDWRKQAHDQAAKVAELEKGIQSHVVAANLAQNHIGKLERDLDNCKTEIQRYIKHIEAIRRFTGEFVPTPYPDSGTPKKTWNEWWAGA